MYYHGLLCTKVKTELVKITIFTPESSASKPSLKDSSQDSCHFHTKYQHVKKLKNHPRTVTELPFPVVLLRLKQLDVASFWSTRRQVLAESSRLPKLLGVKQWEMSTWTPRCLQRWLLLKWLLDLILDKGYFVALVFEAQQHVKDCPSMWWVQSNQGIWIKTTSKNKSK